MVKAISAIPLKTHRKTLCVANPATSIKNAIASEAPKTEIRLKNDFQNFMNLKVGIKSGLHLLEKICMKAQ